MTTISIAGNSHTVWKMEIGEKSLQLSMTNELIHEETTPMKELIKRNNIRVKMQQRWLSDLVRSSVNHKQPWTTREQEQMTTQ